MVILGKFCIESKLQSKAAIDETTKRISSVKSGEISEHDARLKLVIAEYVCNIQNIQLVLSDSEHWKADIECLDTERHILYPLDVSLSAALFIEPEGMLDK